MRFLRVWPKGAMSFAKNKDVFSSSSFAERESVFSMLDRKARQNGFSPF
jgi:hypothetical protein